MHQNQMTDTEISIQPDTEYTSDKMQNLYEVIANSNQATEVEQRNQIDIEIEQTKYTNY